MRFNVPRHESKTSKTSKTSKISRRRIGITLFALSALTGTGLVTAGPANAATTITDPNLAGFIASGAASNVTATIKVPTLTCTTARSGVYLAAMNLTEDHIFGGVYLNAEAGLLLSCVNGRPTYQAYNNADNVERHFGAVAPGDAIKVTVVATSATRRMTVQNVTKSWTKTRTIAPQYVGNTAYFLAGTDATSVAGKTLPLARFSPASFSQVRLGAAALGTRNPIRVEMRTPTNVLRANPSAALTNGTAFTVTWLRS